MIIKSVNQNKNIWSDEKIKDILEADGFDFTNDVSQSLYILRDGTLVNADILSGLRSRDHREIECLFDDIDRYDQNFWTEFHERTGAIMVVPETKELLIMSDQKLTKNQQDIINQNPDFKISEHCRNREEYEKYISDYSNEDNKKDDSEKSVIKYKHSHIYFSAADRKQAVLIFNNELYTGHIHLDALLEAYDKNGIKYNWEDYASDKEMEEALIGKRTELSALSEYDNYLDVLFEEHLEKNFDLIKKYAEENNLIITCHVHDDGLNIKEVDVEATQRNIELKESKRENKQSEIPNNRNTTKYYHGTSYENAMKIMKEGFTSPQINWNCCLGEETYFWKEDKSNPEEVLIWAQGSAQIAAAIQNSQSDKVCILSIEVPENSNIYISPDYSVDDAATIETAVTINNKELNKAISEGKVILSCAEIDKSYNPYMRFVYLSALDNELINIDDFSQTELKAFHTFQNYAPELSGLFEEATNYQNLENIHFSQVNLENTLTNQEKNTDIREFDDFER